MIQAITLSIIAVLVGLDQLIKHIVSANMAVGESKFIIKNFIEIQYCQNFGGMMGTFNGMAKILGIFTILIIVAGLIAIILKKIKLSVPYVCVTMILAGGIGNLIDRLTLGYVIDYINVLFIDFYIFNFADCLVTVGAFVLIGYEIYEIIKDSRKRDKKDA